MANYLNTYRQYFYLEKPTTINELKIGGFYRLYIYKYEDTGITETYNLAKTPILLVIGKSIKNGGMIYALKLNTMPLSRFMQLYDDVQNQSYTKELIKEIESNIGTKSKLNDLDYTTGAKAILIDKTGRGFYNKTISRSRDLWRYDTFRTYRKKNITQIKELYLDLSKLKKKLGFEKFNKDQQE